MVLDHLILTLLLSFKYRGVDMRYANIHVEMVFRRVLASLYEDLSVPPSVRNASTRVFDFGEQD